MIYIFIFDRSHIITDVEFQKKVFSFSGKYGKLRQVGENKMNNGKLKENARYYG